MKAFACGLLLFGFGCSTLDEAGGGGENLPNAKVGPFRELRIAELGEERAAPNVLRDDEEYPRDPAVLDTDGDPSTKATWIFAARTVFGEMEDPDPTAPTNEIIRHASIDGRSFARAFDVVLSPSEPWEMGQVRAPAVVRHEGRILLFYQGGDGIGMASSSDGRAFTKGGRVLSAADGWEERVPPSSPAVIVRSDGSLAMYYAVARPSGHAIGLARSADGDTWERVGDGPILEAAGAEAGVDAPFAFSAVSAEGRAIEYLVYSSIDADGGRNISMAARFGAMGSFRRAPSPVFGTSGSLNPTEPMVIGFGDFRLLFVTQRAGVTDAEDFPAVAAGVAPAAATLPPKDEP